MNPEEQKIYKRLHELGALTDEEKKVYVEKNSVGDSISKTFSNIKQTAKTYKTPLKAAITAGELIGGFTPASPIITGLGEAGTGLLEGKSIPEALRKGAKAGLIDVGLTYTGAKIAKMPSKIAKTAKAIEETGLGKKTYENIGKITKLPGYVVENIHKNPQITEQTPRTAATIGDTLEKAYKAAKEKISKEFEKEIDQFNPLDIVDTSRIPKILRKPSKNLGMVYDPEAIGKQILKEARSQLIDTAALGIEDITKKVMKMNPKTLIFEPVEEKVPGILTKSLEGQPLKLQEARQLNSFAHKISENLIPKEDKAYSSLVKYKKELLNSMDDSVEGIKDVNKNFAARMSKVNQSQAVTHRVNPKTGYLEPKETEIANVSDRLAGAEKLKDVNAKKIQEFSKISQKPFDKIMANNAVATKYQNQVNKGFGLMNSIAAGGGIGGAGLLYGATHAAIPALTALGLGIGGAKLAKPENVKTLLKVAETLPKVGQKIKRTTGVATKLAAAKYAPDFGYQEDNYQAGGY